VLWKILIAFVLVAVTVSVQAVGLAALLKALVKSYAQLPTRFWPVTWLLIRVTWALIFIMLPRLRSGRCSFGGINVCRTSSRLSIFPVLPMPR
jgi:hypothetical protein